MKLQLAILFMLIFLGLKLQAQTIRNIDFFVKDNQIEVVFDLVGKKEQTFNLDVVVELNHQRYYPQNIYGKTKNVKPGKELHLFLKPLEEGLEIKGDLRVGIQATLVLNVQEYSLYEQRGYYPENVVKSAILPGWGHFNTNGQLSNYSGVTISGMFLTCFSGVVYNRAKYRKKHSNYESATSQSDIDYWYNKANQNYKSFQGFIWAGIAIWGLDLWYVNTKVKSDSRDRASSQSLSSSSNFILTADPDNFQLGFKLTF